MITREKRALSNGGLSVIHGFLVPKLSTGAIGVLVAFHILNHWFLYGISDKEEFSKLFKSSCDQQREEIIIALRHFFNLEERSLAKELAMKLAFDSSFSIPSSPSIAAVEPENYYPEERRTGEPIAAWLQAASPKTD